MLQYTHVCPLQEMVAHLPDLEKMLQGKESVSGMQTPFGTLNPPLGSLRLKAVEMVLVLVMVDDASIRQGKPSFLVICFYQLFYFSPLKRID